MFVEYSFSDKHKCYMALCDDPTGEIEEKVMKYWQSHCIENGSYSKFEFHRNNDDEFVGLVACKEINIYALEFALSCFESALGERCGIHDLLRIIRDFDKRFKED